MPSCTDKPQFNKSNSGIIKTKILQFEIFKNMLHKYKGIKVLHIYKTHYFQEKTKFEKVAKMLHNYKISEIIDVQHYRSATRCTTIRLIIYNENNKYGNEVRF